MDLEDQRFDVKLTQAQVVSSPPWINDEPVSAQMRSHTCEHYGWDPLWESPFIGDTPGAMASPLSPPTNMGFGLDLATERGSQVADRRLRSVVEIIGYHVEATEGIIGHVETLMLDDADWSLPYLLVDTMSIFASD